MVTRIVWHPDGFLNELHAILGEKLEESAEVVRDAAKEICPVRTGKLQNSIEENTDKDELVATVGSDVEYAPYVELGTRKMPPKAFLRGGLIQSITFIKAIFSKQ